MARLVARVAAMAALLVGSAALPAATMADARVDQSAGAEDESNTPDWTLLATACVTLIAGRTIVYRFAKGRQKPLP